MSGEQVHERLERVSKRRYYGKNIKGCDKGEMNHVANHRNKKIKKANK